MKFASIFLLILLLSACSKDGVNRGSSFSAKLDGASYGASGIYAYATYFSSDYVIYGLGDKTSTGRSIYISVQKALGPGVYSLKGPQAFALYTDEKGISYRSDYVGGDGEVKITSKTETTVKGTFSGLLKENSNANSKKVSFTAGEFSVQFR